MDLDPIKIGIIGCGAISNLYFAGCQTFPILEIVNCADLDTRKAKSQAEAHSINRHGDVEQLLADPEVDLVVNLTIPKAHTEVNLAAIAAGKHVYCEKPFGISREEGRKVLTAAMTGGLRVGSAPDTFLGESHQTCRKLIDDGAIGQPLSAVAFMAGHGVEAWHPNPGFYYDLGGGPMFDMGPYYLTALVNLLGPARRVNASTKISFPERVITSQPLDGTRIAVKTPTHLAGNVDFQSGVVASIIMSFDTWEHHLPTMEIYGSEGTLSVPDPNSANGAVLLRRMNQTEWTDVPATHTSIPHRGTGVADLAYSIVFDRQSRVSGELALHVVDAMQAFDESSVNERHIVLETTCTQPAPLPIGLKRGELDC